MSKEVYSNDAVNLQLSLSAEISNLLKERGVNISYLNVEVKTFKKKKKNSLKLDGIRIQVNGSINIKFEATLNPDKQKFYALDVDDEELIEEVNFNNS